jgi:hypothetical protein
VLLERVTDADAAGGVAARILDTLHRPFGLNGRTIPIKASPDAPQLSVHVNLSGRQLEEQQLVGEVVQALETASLVTLGCRKGQGFHFARPMTAAAMTELLGKTLADGGFYLPHVAAPVESLSG